MSNGTIIQQGNEYVIDFKFRPAILSAVKNIPGRRYNYRDKTWTAPLSAHQQLLKLAKIHSLSFGGSAQAPESYSAIPELPELTIDIPLKRTLYDFQKKGVAYALDKKRLIMGDTMGLGKTTQAYATIIGAEAYPCLIICPSSLKINWQREIEQNTYQKAVILDDKIRHTFPLFYKQGLVNFFIVNFESLKKYFVESIDDPGKGKPLRLNHIHFKKEYCDLFKAVIIDESHRVKSLRTQQTKFTKGICIGKEYILALTGTPVINKPKDLISQLGIIDRFKEFGGYSSFVERYCSGQKEASNLRELNYRLNTICFYRRDKSQVLKDLPSKTRQVILCDIATRKEYNHALADLETYLKAYKNASDADVRRAMRGEVMVRIGILKNISARGKLSQVYEFIDDLLEQGEKLVLFGHLKEVLGAIIAHYPGCVAITGDHNAAQRQAAIDAFQNDPETKLIVCSAQAAGVGLTLTASSRVAFVELPWTAALCDQAEDRCHRIGQQDNVTCTYFLGQNTIDEWIYKIIREKRSISDQITGASDDVEENMIESVINLFSNE